MLANPYISPNTSNPHISGRDETLPPSLPKAVESSTVKPLLTPDEFRECLGGAIGRNSIYELLRADRIKHVKIGRKILILASEVQEFPEREAEGLS